ncbi:MAG: TonB-dependent receptor [Candidatus Omnitrophota bacterium]
MKRTITALAVLCLAFAACAMAADKTADDNSAKTESGTKIGAAIDTGLDKVLKLMTDPMDKILGSTVELDTIIVTASKIKEKLGSASSMVTVLDEEDFERADHGYVKSALKDEMGVDIVESGAFTGQTSVFMRGANSNHTVVMVDGLKMYDPISPNGAFNLAHLTLDNIERIEVVRGPQSTLYGSDAVGGVINIITKKADRDFFKGSFTAGDFSTFAESFDMGSYAHNLHYTLGGSFTKSRGISQAQAKNNNPELDGYQRFVLSSRVDYDIAEGFTVGGTVRHTGTLYDYDQFGKDDPNISQRDFQTAITQYIEHQPLDFYSYYIKFGWMLNFRKDVDSNDGNQVDYLRDWYKGYEFKFDFRNNFHILEMDTFTIGYEYTWEMGDSYYYLDWGTGDSTSDMPKVFSRNNALYLQNRFNLSDRLTSTQGMRIDDHSDAGTHITYKLDGSYLFPTGTKIRGGWATGFKAPTLYQLHALSTPAVWGWGGFGGGNPDLDPETSQSYEVGVDQYLFSEKVLLHATYFHTMFHGLIGTTTSPTWYVSQYANTGKAHSHGWEIGGKIKPLDNLEIRGSYTYDYTKDYSTDRPLLRRPFNKFKINAYWEIIPKFDFNLEILYNGLRYDNNADKLKSYLVANIALNYEVLPHMSVFAKIVNVFNKRYEEVRSYGTSPFAAYFGTKVDF